jgi:hypothetical protein
MPESAAPEGVLNRNPRDAQARAGTVRLLQVLAAAALLLPLLFFAFAGALSHRATYALADERIERSLDVLQEQALKVFQSMNLALDTIEHMVAGLSEADIRADEEQLHLRLRQIQSALPEVQSIWVFGPAGHPQVITRDFPAPYAEDFAALDYSPCPATVRRASISAASTNRSPAGSLISPSTGRAMTPRANLSASSRCHCCRATSAGFIRIF